VRGVVTGAAAVAAAAAVATAGLAAASPALPAASRSQPGTSWQTITLRVRGGSATFVNIRHKKGYARGDEFIGEQPAYYPASPRQVAGHLYVIIALLSATATRDEATLTLRHGQIDLAGIEAANPFTLAVTGGTGQFAGARGEATMKTENGTGNPGILTVRLLH
jgi:opacity protein-like surface antigen